MSTTVETIEVTERPTVSMGSRLEGELLGSSYVSPHLTIVNFRPKGHWATRRVILVPDNVDSEDFRYLRTRLRWREGDPAQAGES